MRASVVLVVLAGQLAGCTTLLGAYEKGDPLEAADASEGDGDLADTSLSADAAPDAQVDARDATAGDTASTGSDGSIKDGALPIDGGSPADTSDTATPLDSAPDSVNDTRGGGDTASDAGCPPGATMCSGVCKDLRNDPMACGTCTRQCDRDEYCDGTGKCVCRPELTACGFNCVDQHTDPWYCGSCNNICPSGGGCSDQVCVGYCSKVGTIKCPYGTASEFSCVNPKTDVENCGGCGVLCARDELCANGTCAKYAPALDCTTCPCASCAGKACCPSVGTQTAPNCVAAPACP